MMTMETDSKQLNRNTIVALGAATFAAFLLLRLFSHFALAADFSPVPRVEAPAEAVGTYRVRDIYQHGRIYTGSICHPFLDQMGIRQAPHANCGKYLWTLRSDNQLALLQMSEKAERDDSVLHTALFHGSQRNAKCDDVITFKDLRGKLFDSGACRAVRARGDEKRKTEVFVSHEDMAPLTEAIASGLGSFSSKGIPADSPAKYIVEVPHRKDGAAPKTIRITEKLTGVMLVAPMTIYRTYFLERVGE
jgi:hypothetical protein